MVIVVNCVISNDEIVKTSVVLFGMIVDGLKRTGEEMVQLVIDDGCLVALETNKVVPFVDFIFKKRQSRIDCHFFPCRFVVKVHFHKIMSTIDWLGWWVVRQEQKYWTKSWVPFFDYGLSCLHQMSTDKNLHSMMELVWLSKASEGVVMSFTGRYFSLKVGVEDIGETAEKSKFMVNDLHRYAYYYLEREKRRCWIQVDDLTHKQ